MSGGLVWSLREAFASRKPGKAAERQRARLTSAVSFTPVRGKKPPGQSTGGKYRIAVPDKTLDHGETPDALE